ncbi:putative pectinesterase 53 [Raphanus sativus]|nr:putative pectinesterase 53 [Raphanus sativus]
MPKFNSSQAPILFLLLLVIFLCSTQTNCHSKGIRLRPRNQKNVNTTSQSQNPEEEFMKWVRFVGSLKHSVFKAARTNSSLHIHSLSIRITIKVTSLQSKTPLILSLSSTSFVSSSKFMLEFTRKMGVGRRLTYPNEVIHNNRGEGAETTIVEWGDTAQTPDSRGNPMGNFNSASFAVNSPFFVAKNTTFKNTTPVPLPGAVGKQAVALRCQRTMLHFSGVKCLVLKTLSNDHSGRHITKIVTLRDRLTSSLAMPFLSMRDRSIVSWEGMGSLLKSRLCLHVYGNIILPRGWYIGAILHARY